MQQTKQFYVVSYEENGVTKAEPLQIVKPQSISASIDQEYKRLRNRYSSNFEIKMLLAMIFEAAS